MIRLLQEILTTIFAEFIGCNTMRVLGAYKEQMGLKLMMKELTGLINRYS